MDVVEDGVDSAWAQEEEVVGPPREEVDKYLSTYTVVAAESFCCLGRGFGRGPMDDGPPAEVVGIHLLHIKRLITHTKPTYYYI
jgi:hypothetical protein